MSTDRELLELAGRISNESTRCEVDIETLRSLLEYDPDTGNFAWKKRPVDLFTNKRACSVWNAKYAGKPAGYAKGDGYIQICILSRIYRAHRVAFAIYHGRWPDAEVDHINLVRDDNRIHNLREASRSSNICNSPIYKNNTSGVKGVCWEKRRNKWCASIWLNRRKIHVGYFDFLDDAAKAIREARDKMHGKFCRHVDGRAMP